MLIVDTLIIKGVRFVLDKLIQAVDAELNDDTHLRERLLEAQMRLELGELSQEEFAAVEEEVMERLREINAERGGGAAVAMGSGDYEVAGIEAEAKLGYEGEDEDGS
jgi:hypothetical protein